METKWNVSFRFALLSFLLSCFFLQNCEEKKIHQICYQWRLCIDIFFVSSSAARFQGQFNVLLSFYAAWRSQRRWWEGLDKVYSNEWGFYRRQSEKQSATEVSETRQEYQIKINRLLMYIGHYGWKYPGYACSRSLHSTASCSHSRARWRDVWFNLIWEKVQIRWCTEEKKKSTNVSIHLKNKISFA